MALICPCHLSCGDTHQCGISTLLSELVSVIFSVVTHGNVEFFHRFFLILESLQGTTCPCDSYCVFLQSTWACGILTCPYGLLKSERVSFSSFPFFVPLPLQTSPYQELHLFLIFNYSLGYLRVFGSFSSH